MSDQTNVSRLIFHCQQAHGSATGIISNFSSVRELYQRLAECYDISVDQILFCTINTNKLNMDQLLGSDIGIDDFIFVHIKGNSKEATLRKTTPKIGITIADNGSGKCFIKKISPNSDASREPLIAIGDYIEMLNGRPTTGLKPSQLAATLMNMPVGQTCTMKLIEPRQFPMSSVELSTRRPAEGWSRPIKKRNTYQPPTSPAGRHLDEDSQGYAVARDLDQPKGELHQLVIDRINALLLSYMGLADSELSEQIFQIGHPTENPSDFIRFVGQSELADFQFTDEFLFDLWGAIDDAKAGRLARRAPFEYVVV